jgi:hypothetical protein
MGHVEDSAAGARTRRGDMLVGLATAGTAITGVGALFVALFAFFTGRWEATGVCLVAAAIAFGAVVNAVLRA